MPAPDLACARSRTVRRPRRGLDHQCTRLGGQAFALVDHDETRAGGCDFFGARTGGSAVKRRAPASSGDRRCGRRVGRSEQAALAGLARPPEEERRGRAAWGGPVLFRACTSDYHVNPEVAPGVGRISGRHALRRACRVPVSSRLRLRASRWSGRPRRPLPHPLKLVVSPPRTCRLPVRSRGRSRRRRPRCPPGCRTSRWGLPRRCRTRGRPATPLPPAPSPSAWLPLTRPKALRIRQVQASTAWSAGRPRGGSVMTGSRGSRAQGRDAGKGTARCRMTVAGRRAGATDAMGSQMRALFP